jgi:hypothetical protein
LNSRSIKRVVEVNVSVEMIVKAFGSVFMGVPNIMPLIIVLISH